MINILNSIGWAILTWVGVVIVGGVIGVLVLKRPTGQVVSITRFFANSLALAVFFLTLRS